MPDAVTTRAPQINSSFLVVELRCSRNIRLMRRTRTPLEDTCLSNNEAILPNRGENPAQWYWLHSYHGVEFCPKRGKLVYSRQSHPPVAMDEDEGGHFLARQRDIFECSIRLGGSDRVYDCHSHYRNWVSGPHRKGNIASSMLAHLSLQSPTATSNKD